MPTEMLSSKLHAKSLCFLQCESVLYVFRVKAKDEMVLLYFSFFPVLFPLTVPSLAVQVIRPRGRIDGVNQKVFPETLDVVFIINRAGVAVMLKENVSNEVMIIAVMYG